jgi:hypothetical protein
MDRYPKVLNHGSMANRIIRFNEVNFDRRINQGHVMHKLIFRSFPNHFQQNSIYAHFPFVIPSENRQILDNLGTSSQYTWDSPSRVGDKVIIKSYNAVQDILMNQNDYKVTWGGVIEFLSVQPEGNFGKNFALAGDEPANTESRLHLQNVMFPSNWEEEIWTFYTDVTTHLVDNYSVPIGNGLREVDVIRDVMCLGNARFICSMFNLPLKTKGNPRGILTEQEMFLAQFVMFASIFFDADIAKSFQLRTLAREVTQQLGALVQLNAEMVAKTGFMSNVLAKLHIGKDSRKFGSGCDPSLALYGNHFIQRLLEKGKSVQECVWQHIMPLVAAGTANQASLMAQILDFYLEDGKEFLPELYRLAHKNDEESNDLLMR